MCSKTARSNRSRTLPARPSRSTRSARISTTRCARRCISVGLPQDAANLVVVPGPQLEQMLRSSQVDIAALRLLADDLRGRCAEEWRRARRSSTTPTCSARSPAASSCCAATSSRRIRRPRSDFVEQSAPRRSTGARENPEEARKVLAKHPQGARRERRARQVLDRLRRARRRARPVERDLEFWIDVLEREGSLPKGKLKAADLLFQPDARRKSN